MKFPQARVLVMSKAPHPGKVKTRLIPLLGADGAADCHRQLLLDTLEILHMAALCPVELWCAPDSGDDFFRFACEHFTLTLASQRDGDLGQRMSHAVAKVLQYARPVVVIGADCPSLSASDIEAAIETLHNGADVVLGPATDGGYYLIGLRAHYPQLFAGIPWGSAAVLEMTEQRIQQAGLLCNCLPMRCDIDTPNDYRQWQTLRATHR